MPLIFFEASKQLYEVFVGIKNICSVWFEKIGTYRVTDNFALSKKNRFYCTSLGTPCTPACSHFNPLKQCEHSDLEIRQFSIADSVHLFFSQKKDDRIYWENFYECFHPKKSTEEPVKRTTLVFPDDMPVVPDSIIKQTAKASLKLKKDDPKYWSTTRLEWALSDNDKMKKRTAMSDWYWNWYQKVLIPANVELSLKLLKAKHELDEALSKKYNKKDLSDEDMFDVSVSDPIYAEVKRNMDILGSLTGVKVNIIKLVDSDNGIDGNNGQKLSAENSPKIIRHPVLLPHNPLKTDSIRKQSGE